MGNKGIAIRNDSKYTLFLGVKMGPYLTGNWDTIKPGEWFIRDTGRVHLTAVARIWTKKDIFPSETTQCDDLIEKSKLAKRDAESKNETIKYGGGDTGIASFIKGTEAEGNPNVEAAVGVDKYSEACAVMGKETTETDLTLMEEDGLATFFEWDSVLCDGRNFRCHIGGDGKRVFKLDELEKPERNPEKQANQKAA